MAKGGKEASKPMGKMVKMKGGAGGGQGRLDKIKAYGAKPGKSK